MKLHDIRIPFDCEITLDELSPTPLKEYMAASDLNNPSAAEYFNFSVPAIQKMLSSKTRKIGVSVIDGVDKIVETKEIKTLMLYPLNGDDKQYAYSFETPTSYLTVQVIEARGPMKAKDD
jgi:hypothetical protein